jgi:serine/threonine-protein kinase
LPPPLPEGSRLRARYKIARVLSSTRLRNIYLAEDLHHKGKPWVIRQIQPVGFEGADRSWMLNQFESEARVLSSLEHPGLAKIVDFFAQDLCLYTIREFVQGLDLGTILAQRGGRLPERESLTTALAVAEMMQFLLKKKLPPIVFRELSLANLIYTPDGKTKFIDFGFSRLFSREGRLGAPDYSAPEQFTEESGVDSRALVYNTGALLYHLLSGHNPGSTPFSLPPLEQMNHEVSERTLKLVSQAVQNDPERRFSTLADFSKALQAAYAAKPKKVAPKSTKGKKSGGTQRLERIPIPGGAMPVNSVRSETSSWKVWVAVALVALGLGGALVFYLLGSPTSVGALLKNLGL